MNAAASPTPDDSISPNVGTRLLFENDRVRVWDLALQPGEYIEKHVHRDDFLFVVTDGGSLRHVDLTDSANDRAVQYDDGLVVFHEAGQGIVHNRLVNVGDKFYRNIVIELKTVSTEDKGDKDN